MKHNAKCVKCAGCLPFSDPSLSLSYLWARRVLCYPASLSRCDLRVRGFEKRGGPFFLCVCLSLCQRENKRDANADANDAQARRKSASTGDGDAVVCPEKVCVHRARIVNRKMASFKWTGDDAEQSAACCWRRWRWQKGFMFGYVMRSCRLHDFEESRTA